MNRLYYGDNLMILREYVAGESVDLVYLDPPFNSSRSYNVLFKEEGGAEAAAQITAFEDTWHWGMAAEAAYNELVTVADLLNGAEVKTPANVATFKQAERVKEGGRQVGLFDE